MSQHKAEVALWVVSMLVLSCQASVESQPASSPAPKSAAGDPLGTQPSSQLSVGLRVTASEKGEGEGPGVSLVAVVHDADGQTSTRELGTFWGEVSLLSPGADRLMGVSIRGPKSEERVTLVRRPGGIEARRRRTSAKQGDASTREDTLILQIAVPEGTKVIVKDPPLEQAPGSEPGGD